MLLQYMLSLCFRPSICTSQASIVPKRKNAGSENTQHTWIGKCMFLVISSIFLKTKDLSRSQPVMYTVNVVISRKQYHVESLLQTAIRKYRIEAIQWPWLTLKVIFYCKPFKCDFLHSVQQLTSFNWRSIYHSPCVVAAPLVYETSQTYGRQLEGTHLRLSPIKEEIWPLCWIMVNLSRKLAS